MLELPNDGVPPNTDRLVAQLRSQETVPIIAHPERNRGIQKTPSLLNLIIQAGALVQLTAASLTGLFGQAAKTTSHTLLKHNVVHVIATDTHSDTRRPPVLSEGRDAAAGIVGEEAAYRMVQDTPARIVADLPVETHPMTLPDGMVSERKTSWSLLSHLRAR